MKTIFLVTALVAFSLSSFSQSITDNLIASCCDGGRCTGSAYCTACKKCSGCKHCAKNGGSCGVCNGGKTKSYTSSNKSNTRSNSLSTTPKSIMLSAGDQIEVISTTLNVREGAGTNYDIIEKVLEGTKLELVRISGSWLKVKVIKTNTIGFVYAKYVKKV